jgi:hypothetical protein
MFLLSGSRESIRRLGSAGYGLDDILFWLEVTMGNIVLVTVFDSGNHLLE